MKLSRKAVRLRRPGVIDERVYQELHRSVRRHAAKRGYCALCGHMGRTEWALAASRHYTAELADYRELCRRCHAGLRPTDGSLLRSIEAVIASNASTT